MFVLVGYSRSFLWLLYLFSMDFSSYDYYNVVFVRRFLLQKHNCLPLQIRSVSLEVSNSSLTSLEDLEVLYALKALEAITGQKATFTRTGSRYVGTSKKCFFSTIVNLKKGRTHSFLLLLSLFFLPNLQKLGGRYTRQWVRGSSYTLCCKDLQLFEGCFSVPLRSNVQIIIKAGDNDSYSLLDLLQCLKFNLMQ